jgi:hypothetical protein
MDFTLQDYMLNSLANWTEITAADFEAHQSNGTAHYLSESGSEYYECDGEVYRQSDHWNAAVAGCAWFLDGRTISRLTYGKCKLSDFKPLTLEHAEQIGLSQTSMAGFVHMQVLRSQERTTILKGNGELLDSSIPPKN